MSAAKDAEGAGDIRVPQWATYASLASLAVLYLMMALWEHLTSLYLFALVAWLVLAGGLLATRLHRRLLGLDGLRLTFVVFLVALGVRLVMLFNDQVITRDIEMFNHRGWEYLNGALPYSDALSVHKPPSYLYLAAGFSATVGPSLLATRALMSIVDGLVAVMVLWMGQDRLSPTLGLMAGMLYALNPISAIAVGLSGHYDPFVVAFALGGLWLALRGRRLWASLALGVGFALKIYPAVLLPWLLLMEKSWRNRVLMVVLFAVPMVLSWIPVLMQNPEALGTYLKWQGSWIPKKGFAWGVAMMMGWERESVAAGAMARVVEYVFYALLVAMFLDWLRRRQRAPDRHLLDWFKVVSVGFYLLYGFIFMGSVMDFRFDLGVDHAVLGVMVAAIYFPLAGGGALVAVDTLAGARAHLRGGGPDHHAGRPFCEPTAPELGPVQPLVPAVATTPCPAGPFLADPGLLELPPRLERRGTRGHPLARGRAPPAPHPLGLLPYGRRPGGPSP